jgi:peptide chain release factor 2
LEKKTLADNLWEDPESAQKILKDISRIKEWVDAWERLEQELSDIEILTELSAQEGDESSLKELEVSLAKLEEEIDKLEMRKMLGGEDDKRNAILTIHPGAGGTESADWAEMLLRMYLRYFERCGFDKETLDILQDDIAGIKSVTIEVKGEYAFGLLKSENGIHRLVRISPFDANSKRHTSFASVFVMPVIDTEVNIDINPADLRIDTYRASGAGGQHINKTDSAVRITHIPTNMVVTCQSERSQHRNKANAMKILYSRLYQMKKAEAESSLNTLHKSKKDIAWGSQIRSYVFHPYNMVKDHRTGVETGNIQAVMDGDLDKFVRGYLLKAKS